MTDMENHQKNRARAGLRRGSRVGQSVFAHQVAAQQAAGLDNDPIGAAHRDIQPPVEADDPALIHPRHPLDSGLAHPE